ncbi:uncharacterized protein gzf1 [Eucyclogobius newberryi]|uniref:uncharacterized protein gzf1 n=1 Tax=Eucyclogobius newberryi TaxID=166745 RepID=UPI003B5A57C4
MAVSGILLESASHPANMLASLNELRLREQLSDITVRVDFQGVAEEFRAHWSMLAASSGYFKSAALSEHRAQDKVLLTNMRAADFRTFLEFVYTGRAEVGGGKVDDVRAMAKFLDCRELLVLCEETRKREKIQTIATDSTAAAAEREKENNPRRSKRRKRKKKPESDDGDHAPTSDEAKGKTPALRDARDAAETDKESADDDEEEAEVESPEPKKSKGAVPSDEEWTPEDNVPNDCGGDGFLVGFEGHEPLGDDSLEEGEGEEEEEGEGEDTVFKWTSKAQFECTECQRTFHYEKSFLKHRSTYHGVMSEIVHRCKICQQSFANRSNLKTHEKHVHSTERLFCCGTCAKDFKRKKDLVRHQRQVHEREYSKQICSVCGKTLSCKNNLLLHERIHTGTKPYHCSVCNARFTQKTALNMHYRTHTGEKPFACTMCTARFTQKQMLTSHIRSHTGEKPFMCEACGKSFSSREYLRHHLNIHTGNKPFKCEHCGRGFSQRNSLNQHVKIHTGDRPYACPFCEKQFTQLNALQRHRRIHTGEKPYMCSMCNRTFTDKSTLRRHTTTHSSDAPWTSYLVVLEGNIEDKKNPEELKKKSPKTVDKKNKLSTKEGDEAKPARKSETTETSTVTVPPNWASHGAIALVSHAALGGITVIHTEIPAGTKLQPVVNTDSTGASVLSLDNSSITVPFSIAASVAQSMSTATIPAVTISDGALAIVSESPTISTQSVLEVAASQTILASGSDSKSNDENIVVLNDESEVENVETEVVTNLETEVVTTTEIEEAKSEAKDDNKRQN